MCALFRKLQKISGLIFTNLAKKEFSSNPNAFNSESFENNYINLFINNHGKINDNINNENKNSYNIDENPFDVTDLEYFGENIKVKNQILIFN